MLPIAPITRSTSSSKRIKMSSEQSLDKRFLDAIKEGNVEEVKEALTLGCDVNCMDEEERSTGLMMCSGRYLNLDIIHILLEHPSIDVNNKGLKIYEFGRYLINENDTALHAAYYYNNEMAVERLRKVSCLEKEYQNIVFLEALEEGNLEIAKEAINNGCDVNCMDPYGDTALGRVCGQKPLRTDLLELLLQHPEIDVNKKGMFGQTAIEKASDPRFGNQEALEILRRLPGQERELENINFINAVLEGDIEKIRDALRKGCDVNYCGSRGGTGLMICSGSNFNLDIMNTLLEHPDIDVNRKNQENNTALHRACRYNQPNAIKRLAQVPDLEINKGNCDNNHPIMVALESRNIEALQELINIPKIDLNVINNEGENVVIQAFKKNHFDIYEILVNTPGVDLTITDSNKRTVKDMSFEVSLKKRFLKAIREGNVDELKQTLTLGCDVNFVDGQHNTTGLIMASGEYFNIDIINVLLEHPDIDVNKEGGSGFMEPALFQACEYNKPQAVQRLGKVPFLNWLAGSGTWSEGKTINGGPVTKAVLQGSLEALEELIKIAGVDVNVGDCDGDSPITTAAHKQKWDIFNILVDAGADLSVSDCFGTTLRSIVRRSGKTELLDLFPAVEDDDDDEENDDCFQYYAGG